MQNSHIPYGYQKDSIAELSISVSQDETVKKINFLAGYLFPEFQSTTLEEKVQSVIKGNYRLIGDGYTLKYLAQKNCLSVSSVDLNEQYAMVIQRHSILTAYLNGIITQMRYEQLLEPLIQK